MSMVRLYVCMRIYMPLSVAPQTQSLLAMNGLAIGPIIEKPRAQRRAVVWRRGEKKA